MNAFATVVLTGVGATALTDLWSVLRERLLGTPAPKFGLIGRWFGHMPSGRFRHASIADAKPIRHELAVGWCAHYLIGVALAALIPLAWDARWLLTPTPGPALTIGLLTVLAPFLLMQPGMGLGLAARKAKFPWRARLQSLSTHLAFGLGLYLSAMATTLLSFD